MHRTTNEYGFSALKTFTLVDSDGLSSRVRIAEFCDDNGLEASEVNRIGRMQAGDEVSFGGGAAPLFVLRRTS
jgi:hypothetical protein